MSFSACNPVGKISLCMITKNEEEFLPQCLKSVQELVHEIIIVDTGSTDRTIDIAADFGAKIYQHPWEDDFSKHRNQSISYATGEWILIMDADEVIAKRDLARIKGVLDTVRADGFFFTLRNYESTSNLANLTLNTGDYEEGEGFPGFISSDLIRLFRNDPLIYFTGQVHETVTQTIVQSKKTTFITGIPIHHYGKVRGDRIKRKQDSYLALGMKRLDENPRDPVAYKGLSDQLLELGLPQEALDIANRGLAVFPDMLDLRFNRGLALDRLDRHNEAEKEYLLVLSRQSDHLGACHNLGQIFFRRNQFEKVIRLLNRGIEKGLRHPAVFFLLGRAFGATGDGRKALENFQWVLDLQSNYRDVNCHIAVIFLNNHLYNDALKALEREIEIGGNLVAAYNLLGEMSLYWKDSESAGNFFLKVLAIEPDNPTAKKHLERIGCDGPEKNL
jgi:glycosyltransferase involved in cell wall biosynthesis